MLYGGTEAVDFGEDCVVFGELFGHGRQLFIDRSRSGHHAISHEVNESTKLMQAIGLDG